MMYQKLYVYSPPNLSLAYTSSHLILRCILYTFRILAAKFDAGLVKTPDKDYHKNYIAATVGSAVSLPRYRCLEELLAKKVGRVGPNLVYTSSVINKLSNFFYPKQAPRFAIRSFPHVPT